MWCDKYQIAGSYPFELFFKSEGVLYEEFNSERIPIALLFFNVGVEIGQLIFIAAVLTIIAAGHWMVQRSKIMLPLLLWRIPPYAIGGYASFRVIERVAAF